MNKTAFGLIDAQAGFMPAEEGERLGVAGFGELPIANGEKIVPNVNALLGAFAVRNLDIFTTQDWHPENTAHFADNPNFSTTWPRHCVADTPGAALHSDIQVPDTAVAFKKGYEVLEDGAEDTSYTGYNGINESGETLRDWLQSRGTTEVVLGGLALDYCVKATALDLRQKLGLDVVLVTDATKAVAAETGAASLEELEAAGVKFLTTAELLETLAATAE
jgi:nicotinamidase/pyrazinamidase